jgi:hypothetical protein
MVILFLLPSIRPLALIVHGDLVLLCPPSYNCLLLTLYDSSPLIVQFYDSWSTIFRRPLNPHHPLQLGIFFEQAAKRTLR